MIKLFYQHSYVGASAAWPCQPDKKNTQNKTTQKDPLSDLFKTETEAQLEVRGRIFLVIQKDIAPNRRGREEKIQSNH